MTSIAVLVVALLFVGWIISLFPSLIQWLVVIVASLAGMILLLPAPVYLYAVLAPNPELRDWMFEAGFYTFMLWGIGAVIVAALFYQGWQSSEHVEEEEELLT